MDKNSAKSEIKEKIGIDQIINEQMEQKNPDAISELNERDIEKIKRKMQAELERELDERLDQKIEAQVEQKLKEQERKGTAFVFRPLKPLDVSRTTHDTKEMNRVYQQGREEALQRLGELKKFLAGEEETSTPDQSHE